MENTVQLYDRPARERLEKRYKRGRTAALLIAAAALTACVALCALTDTGNAEQMERRVLVLSVLAGWAVIWLLQNHVAPARHELVHARMLDEGERSAAEGVLTVSDERMHIRGSIRFYPLTLQTGEETVKSKVIASRAALLRAENGRRVRLYTVNGYAAAYERL